MNRRGFFKRMFGAAAGLFGIKVYAGQPKKLSPGQLWWDKDCCWTSGWMEAKQVCLLLSADMETFWDGERMYMWEVARFQWFGRDNETPWMGAPISKFTESEVRKMYYVGGIEQVMNFPLKK